MSHLLARSPEVIPGYTVLERIGAGGYGEVWKAGAPGGLVKAIKFVYGCLDEERAACELKALARVKEVRHPFLLSLERIEVVDRQLVIVTELADGSLKDRCAECRAGGGPGIPREELLRHLRDAADALDYMSERFSLQHLDIKPENLLTVGGRVKVADFGLVKDVYDGSVSLLGGLTPLYAAPEVFLGRPSLHNDRYSLAIIYCELRTEGVRPLGRLALVDHAQDLLPKLNAALDALASPEALDALAQRTGAAVDPAPRIVLLASVCGGTGSGMVLDLAYAARKALADRAAAGGSVAGLLVHCTRRNPNERLLATANAWACLRELRRYACGGGYPGGDDFGLPSFAPEVPPFDDTAIVHWGDGIEAVESERGADALGDYLDLATATAGGALADQRSAAENVLAAPQPAELAVRTFGSYALEDALVDLVEPDHVSPALEQIFEHARIATRLRTRLDIAW